jgi:ligand-binding SRPBCC domain-containing protein
MRFTKESIIRAAPEQVFDFHEQPNAIEILMPPWEDATVIRKANISVIGSQAIIDTNIFGIWGSRWVAEHTAYEPPRMFEDVQIAGPFNKWRHQHIIEPHPDGCILRDEIDYEPPFWIIGEVAAYFLIQPKLERMFCYRHAITRKWCETDQI